ncbi:glycosyltransferase [Nocardia gipuzkoensis]
MSARGFFIAAELGRRGHEVHVFSDSLSAESHERVTEAPLAELFDNTGPNVTLHLAEDVDRVFYRRHPPGRPAVSQLSSLALAVADASPPDVILGSFMEPYCVAAYLVSKAVGAPLVTTHAGSDLGRLMRARDSQFLFHRIFRDSTAVLTTPRHSVYLNLMGISPKKLHAMPVPAPAWLPDAPAPPRGGSPTVLVYGKLPADDYVSRIVDDCMRAGVQAKIVGHPAWPKADGSSFAAGHPFVWPWKVPELIAECSIVLALRSSGSQEIAHHHGLTPVEAAAVGRPVALHPSDAANFHMTELGLPTSQQEMMEILTSPSRRENLAEIGRSCFDWLNRQLTSGEIGLVRFESYVDRIEDVLTAPETPSDTDVVEDRTSRFMAADTGFEIDPDILKEVRGRIYRPTTAVIGHREHAVSPSDRYVRRVPIEYFELPDRQFYLLVHSAGSHGHEHVVSERAMQLLKSADGKKRPTDLEVAELGQLRALEARGLISICDLSLVPPTDITPTMNRIDVGHG